ncbi:UNVERIFIED_CONTAM: hypothetical protein RMT77_015961 [Armadillidium vulgare]
MKDLYDANGRILNSKEGKNVKVFVLNNYSNHSIVILLSRVVEQKWCSSPSWSQRPESKWNRLQELGVRVRAGARGQNLSRTDFKSLMSEFELELEPEARTQVEQTPRTWRPSLSRSPRPES